MTLKTILTPRPLPTYREWVTGVLEESNQMGVPAACLMYGVSKSSIYRWRKEVDVKKPDALDRKILDAIHSLGDNAYGVTVNSIMCLTYGNLYLHLDRLEDMGYIESSHGAATPERGGRKKRMLKLTRFALEESEGKYEK